MIRQLCTAALATVVAAPPGVAQTAPVDTLSHGGYPRAPSDSTGWVTSRYDAEQDRTIVELRRRQLDSALSVTALVALEGRTVRKEAPGVVFTLWSTATRGRLAADPHVALELDGRRIDLHKMWIPPSPRAPYTETGMTSTNLNVWLALASAQHAALIVGENRFELSDDYLAGIREFASRMRPDVAP